MEDPVEKTVEGTVEETVEDTIKEVKDEDDVKLAAKKLTDSDALQALPRTGKIAVIKTEQRIQSHLIT